MCCNKQRQQYQQMLSAQNGNSPAPNQNASRSRAVPTAVAPQHSRPHFEYTGKTALTVVSPLTGRYYRFQKPGARVEVDGQDRLWLTFVPNLKQCGGFV